MTRPKRTTPSKYRRPEPESKVANVCTQTDLSQEGLQEIISQFIQSQNKVEWKSKTKVGSQNSDLVQLTFDEWLMRFSQMKSVNDSFQENHVSFKSINGKSMQTNDVELEKEPKSYPVNQTCVKVEVDAKNCVSSEGNGVTENRSLVNGDDGGKIFSMSEMITRSHHNAARSQEKPSGNNLLVTSKKTNRNAERNEVTVISADVPEHDVKKVNTSLISLLHHTCDICSEVFKIHSELQKHRKVKHDGFVSKCDKCDKLFSTRTKMEIHRRLHTGDKPYKCDQCGRSYGEISTLRKHIIKTKHKCNDVVFKRRKANNVKSTARKIPCDICGKVLHDVKTLRSHMRLHDGVNCKECGKPFKSDHTLKQHLKMKHSQKVVKRRGRTSKIPNICLICHHPTKHYVRHMLTHLADVPNMCKFCAKILDNKEELLLHLESHSADEIQVCDKCGKAFGSRGRLNEHKRIHQRAALDQRTIFTCDLCNMGFLEEVQMQEHVDCHNNKSDFKCVQCSNTFPTPSELKTHMFSHKGEKSPVNCPTCNIMCPTKSWYSRHKVKKHTKNHMCSICGKQFSNKLDLTRHTMLHTGNFKHKCGICSKGFIQLEKLKLHMCIHSGEKPYSCEHCGCTFYVESLLKRHLLQHDINADLMCPECKLSFQDQVKLDRHLREHKKNYPIMCSYCDLGFVDTRYRRNHMRSVHGVKDFVCDLCSEDFNCRVDLINHKSSVHGPEFIFTCNICDKRFIKKVELTVHTRKTHRKSIRLDNFTLKEDPNFENSNVTEPSDIKRVKKIPTTKMVVESRPNQCSLCGGIMDVKDGGIVPLVCEQCQDDIDHNVMNADNSTENILLEIPSEIATQGPAPGALTCLACSKTFVLFDNFIAHMHEHPELQIKVETVQ